MQNLRLKKSLGQNLMADKNIVQKIINNAKLCPDDVVVEIGTGTGILTKEIAKKASKVISFEIDKKIIIAAREYLEGFNNIEIINEDFLKYNLNTTLQKYGSHNLKAVANLPYYITSPIIEKIFISKLFSDAVLTVQKEFAQRITAKPRTKSYGSFTIFVNYYSEPLIISKVSKSSFLPKPKVDSAIVFLKIRKTPIVHVKSEETFFKIVRAAFGQRRKILRNALSSKFDLKKIDAALSISNIDPMRRGETLAIEEFADITNKFL